MTDVLSSLLPDNINEDDCCDCSMEHPEDTATLSSNNCSVVYDKDKDFGELPTEFTDNSLRQTTQIPSKLIDQNTLSHQQRCRKSLFAGCTVISPHKNVYCVYKTYVIDIRSPHVVTSLFLFCLFSVTLCFICSGEKDKDRPTLLAQIPNY